MARDTKRPTDHGMVPGTIVCQYDDPPHRATLRLTLTTLDGTVLDVAVGCVNCWRRDLASLGLHPGKIE